VTDIRRTRRHASQIATCTHAIKTGGKTIEEIARGNVCERSMTI